MEKTVAKNLVLERLAYVRDLADGALLVKTANRTSLLDNIIHKLSPDFIGGGHKLHPSVEDKLDDISDGFRTITKVVKHNDEPAIVEHEEEPIDDLHGDMVGELDGMLNWIKDFDPSDLFSHVEDMMNDMFGGREKEDDVEELRPTEEVGGQRPLNFDDIEESMKRGLEDGDVHQDEFDECVNGLNRRRGHKDCCECCGKDMCECCDDEEDEDRFIDDKIKPASIVEGDHDVDWDRAGGDICKCAADLNVAHKMITAAIDGSDKIDKEAIMTMLDPSKYASLPEDIAEQMIDVYADMADTYTKREARNTQAKMQKVAYYVVDTLDPRNSNDRVRENGPMPPNYQQFLKNVGETHHQAMSRLQELKNPLNEVNALRIPDGKRSNPIKPENASIETRMQKQNVNDTKFSPVDSMEKKLSALTKKQTGHNEVDEKNTEALLGNDKDLEKLWYVTYEQRLSEHSHKDDEPATTETKLSKDDKRGDSYNMVVDQLLEDWRKEKKKLLKTSANYTFGGGNFLAPNEVPLPDKEQLQQELEELQRPKWATTESKLGGEGGFGNNTNPATLESFEEALPSPDSYKEPMHVGMGQTLGNQGEHPRGFDQETAQQALQRGNPSHYPSKVTDIFGAQL